VSKDLGVSLESLRKWVNQAKVGAGERAGLTIEERAELSRLRRENRTLRMERNLLKKAGAFFAREIETA
jgi:transposase